MKKIIFGLIAVGLVAATQALATSVTVRGNLGYAYGDGGEFNISPVFSGANYASDCIVNGGFETFCVQTSVPIVVPGTYNASLSSFDSQGKALTVGVAWLYTLFAANGNLIGYDYNPGPPQAGTRALSANKLQQAIWILQGQTGGDITQTAATSFYVQQAVTHFGSLAGAEAANNGQFQVQIVNLFAVTGAPVQNMLALVPDGGSTVMFLGMALSCLALVSRKMRVRA